jgi:hypothetical protein
MGKERWPWNDTHDAKLKRIVESYRTALFQVAPDVCQLLDARMIECGQRWVCGDYIVDVDRLVSAREVSEEFGLPGWSVHEWSRRHPDLIPKHKQDDGSVLFRLGDVLRYHALKEGRLTGQ